MLFFFPTRVCEREVDNKAVKPRNRIDSKPIALLQPSVGECSLSLSFPLAGLSGFGGVFFSMRGLSKAETMETDFSEAEDVVFASDSGPLSEGDGMGLVATLAEEIFETGFPPREDPLQVQCPSERVGNGGRLS